MSRRSINRRAFAPLLAVAALLSLPSAAPADDGKVRALPASVSVITRDEFANRQWFSVSDVLDQIPSVNVARTGYRGNDATARLRGLSGGDALVIAIDGRPLTNDFDGAVDLSQIPLNMVDRIEVTRGGANVIYGPAKAGLVNIVTTRPARKGLTVDLNTAVGRAGVKDNNGRFLLRNWAGDLLYIGGLEDSGGFLDNQGSKYQSHFANFTRSFEKGGYFGAEYLFTNGKEGQPFGTAVPFDQWNSHAEKIAVSTDTTAEREFQMLKFFVETPKTLGGAFRLEGTQSHRDVDRFGGGAQFQDAATYTTDVRLNYNQRGLDVGGVYSAERRRQNNFRNVATDNSGVYLTNRFASGQWTFVPGVRWDNHSASGQAPTYRAALLYQPAENWTASLTGQRAPRFATLTEAFDAAGASRRLDPEKSDSIDGGLVWSPGPVRLSGTVFSARTKDVIGVDALGGLSNGARERSSGVETEASGRIGRGNWSELHLRGGWTYQTARRRDIGGAAYGRAPLAPRSLAWAAGDLVLPWKMTLTNEVRYKSEQYTGTGRTGVKIPPFTVWNARLGVKIWSADLYFACENLLRRRYAESVSPLGDLEPQAERTFWAGVTIRFLD